MKKLYVAYGSNLNLAQMAARCPSATIYATGQLNDWELIYRGSPGNSHATIRRCKGTNTPVLIWNITPTDERRLDIYEGYPIYYFKKNIVVTINEEKIKAMVYIMDESKLPGKPSAEYIKTIQQGYLDNYFDLSILKKSLLINSKECK